MKKNIIVKIFAFLALFGILIGILGTGILFFMSKRTNIIEDNSKITQEELNMLINNMKKTSSGETQTGEIQNEDIVNITQSGVLISTGELNNK